MDKRYSFQEIEKRVYKGWEESGFFNPDNLPGERSRAYTVVIPPPNITGSLHMGHALNISIQDVLIRKKRMEGYRALWIPGLDHAGIATQNVVEKKLRKEGKSRFDLGKEKFVQSVWEWKDHFEKIIIDQIKKTGASCDWSRLRFTFDENYCQAVKKAFQQYQEKGWIYQDKRLINWCPRCQTTLSDLELEHRQEKTKLWYIRYPIKDSSSSITIATTRPETMLGDSAVAVNPKDKRYQKLQGAMVILPLTQREIPIIADRLVDPEFGTGAVKVTPAHDLIDHEIAQRHHLPLWQVIDEKTKMTGDIPEKYQGLSIKEARRIIIEDLEEKDFLIKTEDYLHSVPVCYRCQTEIETIPSQQWFLKMDKLASLARQAIEEKKIAFYPSRWEKVYLDWLEGIHDWCISRQLWWGHKIPVAGEEDVLDTWFSSALWPFAALGWPEKTKDLEASYPIDLISTGVDIMNLWVTRMIFSGCEFMKEIPFRKVYFHPTILTKDGRRMSKSLGTGVDPLKLIEEYGADATRFGLLWQTTQGRQDIRFSEEDIVMGNKFGTKIWNASRFILQQIEQSGFEKIDIAKINPDQEIVQKVNNLSIALSEDIEQFSFSQATHRLYDFFWHDFCDQYLEEVKTLIKETTSPEKKREIIKTLLFVLTTSLKLLHPFMPFISEEIYHMLPLASKKTFLMIEDWPIK